LAWVRSCRRGVTQQIKAIEWTVGNYMKTGTREGLARMGLMQSEIAGMQRKMPTKKQPLSEDTQVPPRLPGVKEITTASGHMGSGIERSLSLSL
jgi:hypothetical protein